MNIFKLPGFINLNKRFYKFKWSKNLILRIIVASLLLWFAFCLPESLFKDPSSTIVTDINNELLAARIAEDGQWRFPEMDSVPRKFEQSLIYFEDQYFRYHPGVNPVSLVKSVIANMKAGEVVRGGSTITAQLIRLSRKGKPRNIYQKFIEFILAFRIELDLSKDEILTLYASHAPFGGNVVGLQAASWRYYGRPPEKLSWGESATLAVLPNAPALIYPGKNHEKLLAKRNQLLDKLYNNNIIDSLTCELAKYEPLPGKPKPLPQYAPHLLSRVIQEGHAGNNVQVTVDKKIQVQANRIVDKYHQALMNNDVFNAAAIILDVKSGDVLAYVGNTNMDEEDAGNFVDIITSHRSSGSTLKPFLFALMLKNGVILPNTLVADIPTQISGFSPKNFNKGYDGAVPAGNALARSLNIPAVRMLQTYGLNKFHHQIAQIGLTSIDKSSGYYGLSLILGGAEVTLWELSSAYASMARMLVEYTDGESEYFSNNYHPANFYRNNQSTGEKLVRESDIIEAGPAWLTFQALTEMNRPIEGNVWHRFSSSKKIAWKTGTSFGHRDAWAVGVTPKFVVGVWVGNADGEGRPGLTGASSAAPLMFELYKILPETGWFDTPYDDLVRLAVCSKSGYKAGKLCKDVDTIYVPVNGLKTSPCPYHKEVFLDKTGQYQVNSDCYPVSKMKKEIRFILPTVMEWYYKSKDPYYKPLPRYYKDCHGTGRDLDLIYPHNNTDIYIPRGFGGEVQRTVFEAAHRDPNAVIYWHLDDKYIGETSGIHQMEIITEVGEHELTLVSEDGEILVRKFRVIER